MRSKGFKKTAEVAGKIEVVSKGVKNTALELDSKYGNDGHRATRSSRPENVIVRARDSALPNIGARVFVDPLDGEKAVYACPVILKMGDPETGSLASTYVSDYLFPAYDNAIMQGVKYDVSGLFDESKFRAYHDHILKAIATYYFVSFQRSFSSDPNLNSRSFSVRDANIYGPGTEESLRVLRNRIQQYCVSPNLVSLMKWLFPIRSAGRTPNANLLQFCPDTSLLTAEDDDAISIILRTTISELTSADNKVSSLIGKIQPDWQIKLDHYTDVNANPEVDFNWFNVWVNFGIGRVEPEDNLPYDNMEYVLYNDNPNAICTTLSTIYDSTNTVWDPGLITPITSLSTGTYIIDDSTGMYIALAATSERILGAQRYYEYEQGTTPIDVITAIPESTAVVSNAIDTKPDVQSIMKYLFNLEVIQNNGLSSMRNLVKR
uniref:Uncharacterized protein n=1 Tax=viral metagenome TaxID=1070528 RepID=A0A2V0R9K9_9ZZZZ